MRLPDVPGLPLESRVLRPGESPVLLLQRPGEEPLAGRHPLILLSAPLLRALLRASRALGPRRARRRAARRLDIRV